jgi:hypothetical protein
MTDQGSTYSDPAVRAAVREATGRPEPADPEADVVAQMQAQLEGVNAANHGMSRELEALRARARVLQEAGRLISEESEKTRTERDELADKVDELEAALAYRAYMRTGNIDPTPGRVTAYIRAVREKMEAGDFHGPSDPATIRAGLAAVQWALLNPTTPTGGEEVGPNRERIGDRLTLTGTICATDTEDTLMVELWGRNYWLTETDVTVTRPAEPLPTEPGSLVEADVRGWAVTLVLTDDPDPEYRWFIVTGHDPDRRSRDRWVRAEEVTRHRVLSVPDAP